MGTKSSKAAHGAAGKSNLLLFDPDELHLITDKAHKLYDPRVEDPVDETLVASILFKGVVESIIVWKDPELGKTCVTRLVRSSVPCCISTGISRRKRSQSRCRASRPRPSRRSA